MNEIGGLYAEGRNRLSEIVVDLRPADFRRIVPACPKWTVRDVIAHLAGGCADLLAGNIDGVTTTQWADAQVRRRQNQTITQLVAEWSDVAPSLEAMADSLPSPLATMWILDLSAHEHDVRGALARPGARETRGLVMAVDFLLREGLHRQLVGSGLGPVAVRTPMVSWIVGGQEPSAEVSTQARSVVGSDRSGTDVPSPAAAGRAPTAVELSLFEAFRALTGRRSAAQIARFDWTSDPDPFLPAFQFGTFTTRMSDLVE
jgi:uncharacterized protein (TIGR03083 family)